MTITHEMHAEGDLLRVTAQGFNETLGEMQAYSLAVVAAAVEHECTRVICDERALDHRLSMLDSYQLAQAILATVPRMARVALVITPDSRENAAFYEDVLVNRGLTLRVFTDFDTADEWISG